MNHRLATAHPVKHYEIGEYSTTVPDQSMTCREIMNRHTRGMRIPDAMLQGVYDEYDDPLQLNGKMYHMLSLEEKMQCLKNMRESNREKRAKYQYQEQERTKNQQTADFAQAVQEAVKRAQNQQAKSISTP